MTVRDKILIAEDEKSISGFIGAILSSNGYDVLFARSGNEACSMITSHCPDLVILDLGLPDMDGMEIIEWVRTWTQLPIVVVSARGNEKDKVAALEHAKIAVRMEPNNLEYRRLLEQLQSGADFYDNYTRRYARSVNLNPLWLGLCAASLCTGGRCGLPLIFCC